jgi:hypothetical protein
MHEKLLSAVLLTMVPAAPVVAALLVPHLVLVAGVVFFAVGQGSTTSVLADEIRPAVV